MVKEYVRVAMQRNTRDKLKSKASLNGLKLTDYFDELADDDVILKPKRGNKHEKSFWRI